MIKIEQELQLDHIYSYLNQNKNNSNEFDRYLKSLSTKIIEEKNEPIYGMLKYILIKYFDKCDAYLDNIISKININKYKGGSIYLAPIFGYSKNNKKISISKNIFYNIDESIKIFDNIIFKDSASYSKFLNIEDLILGNEISNKAISIESKKTFSGFIVFLSDEQITFDEYLINDDDAYISFKPPFEFSLSEIIKTNEFFFNQEKIKKNFEDITRQIDCVDISIDVEVTEDLSGINIFFYNKKHSQKKPIHIIDITCKNYDELVFHVDVIDDILKKKGLDYIIRQ